MIWDTPILGNHNLVNSKLQTSSPCVLFIGIERAGLIWFKGSPRPHFVTNQHVTRVQGQVVLVPMYPNEVG